MANVSEPLSRANVAADARSIGQILQGLGKLRQEDIDRILPLHREHGLRFGEAARRLRLVTRADVEFALAAQLGLHYPQPGKHRLDRWRGLFNRLYPILTELWQVLDILAVALGFYVLLRVEGGGLESTHLLLLGITAAFMFLVYSWSDIYYRIRARSLWQEAQGLFKAWGSVALLLLAVGYVTSSLHLFGRELILTWVTGAYLAQLLVHFVVRQSLHTLRRSGCNIRRALVVGCGAPVERFSRLVSKNPWLGIQIEGYVADPAWFGDGGAWSHSGAMALPADIRYQGGLENVAALVDLFSIGEIYVALPIELSADAENVVRSLVKLPVDVNWLPDLSVAQMLSTRAGEIDGQPVVVLLESPIQRHGRWFKRLMDIALSAVLIVSLSPLLIGVAWTIKQSSPGPILFKQQRLGLGGRRFPVWKFRTMRVAPAGELQQQATRDDDRVTPVGRWIRRWSLDELPQLFNVLQGDMSLVGPRPHPLWLNDRFSDVIYAYMQRHRVKPGLTGWAQVHGFRGETDTPEKMEQRVKYDLEYVTHWSPWMDAVILFRTVVVVLRGDNAY